MSRLFDDGAGDQLKITSAVITAYPWTVSAWVYSDDATIPQGVFAMGNDGVTDREWLIILRGNVAGDPVAAMVANSSAFVIASTTTGYSVNTWHHVCGVFASTTSRAVFIDGGSKGTNTNTQTAPSSPNATYIGRRANTNTAHFSGRIAEVCLWDVALTDGEVASLAKAISPLGTRPGNLVAYWPLYGRHSPEIDPWGKNDMTLTGTAAAVHPRKIMTQRGRAFIPEPAAPGGDAVPQVWAQYRRRAG